MIELKTLGKKIKERRLSLGLTQEQLAERIGVGCKHLSRIELGQHNPSYTMMLKLSSVLDLDLYNLTKEANYIPQSISKSTIQSLRIINSSKSEVESQLYLEALKHTQKCLRH